MNSARKIAVVSGDRPPDGSNDGGSGSEANAAASGNTAGRFRVVVIGGGQAGLAVGYHLAQRGIDFVILEKAARLGDSWRRRWDSLRLFTPAQYDGLPGFAFPAARGSYPSKDEMAQYLEDYAKRFSLPVRLGTNVLSLTRGEGGRFLVECADGHLEADQVIVTTGAHATHRRPNFAADLDPHIIQVHAGDYRNPSQLQPGAVLVVGAGNSGSEIALEAAQAGHSTWLAGRSTGEVPSAAYGFDGRIFWFIANKVLTVGTPFGRKARGPIVSRGGPLINLKRQDVIRAGVEVTSRVTSVSDGRPQLEHGRCLDVANVIWSTGFGQDFSWIRLPVLGSDGMPEHQRGVVASEPGLYFVGLPFLTKFASAFVGGVGEDAAAVVEHAAGLSSTRVHNDRSRSAGGAQPVRPPGTVGQVTDRPSSPTLGEQRPPRLIRDAFFVPRGVLGRIGGWLMARGVLQQQEVADSVVAWAPKRLCEVGSGPGVLAQLLAQSRPEMHLDLVDPSPIMRAQSSRRCQKAIADGRLTVQSGSADALPFADETFDAVVATNNVTMWPDLVAGLIEIRRVLRPQGRLLLSWHSATAPGTTERRLALPDSDLDKITKALQDTFGSAQRRVGNYSVIWETTRIEVNGPSFWTDTILASQPAAPYAEMSTVYRRRPLAVTSRHATVTMNEQREGSGDERSRKD